MDHVRAGSIHSADTYVPWGGGPTGPATGPIAGDAPDAGTRHRLPRAVLLGATATLAALGIATGTLLALAPAAEPTAPVPAPAAAKPVAECSDQGRSVVGRLTVRTGAGEVPFGVVEVRAAELCASSSPEAGRR